MTTPHMDTQDLERAAYAANNTELVAAYAHIAELELEVEQLEEQIADTTTLEQWERNHGDAQEYYAFFHECFARLNGHYPAPSVSSDYDKGVIFDAITAGDK